VPSGAKLGRNGYIEPYAQVSDLLRQASMKPAEQSSVDESVERSRRLYMSMDRDPNVYDRETRVYDRDRRGSNTLAYLIGGLVIALGLLAFLFYDGQGADEVTTTGTVTEAPATPGATTAPPPTTEPATPVAPNAPAAPGAPAAPAPQ
jgi:hypothetical protein